MGVFFAEFVERLLEEFVEGRGGVDVCEGGVRGEVCGGFEGSEDFCMC